MKILKNVYQAIVNDCSTSSEVGGILGVTSDIITHYQFDTPIDLSEYFYRPNTKSLNLAISEWQKLGIAFAGIFHSHPTGITSLSFGDETYIKKIMRVISLSPLFFPIIAPQNEMQLYKATLENSEITIITEPIDIV